LGDADRQIRLYDELARQLAALIDGERDLSPIAPTWRR
jgi:hypothetical protein